MSNCIELKKNILSTAVKKNFEKNYVKGEADIFPFLYIELPKDNYINVIKIVLPIVNILELKYIIVQYIDEKNSWITVASYSFYSQRNFNINLNQTVCAKKIRIIFSNEEQFKKAKVNVNYKLDELLFIASRLDYIGNKMISLLNAMFIAKKINAQFGYTWYTYDSSLFPMLDRKTNFTTSVIFSGILDEKDLFSQNFIEKYSYTNILDEKTCKEHTNNLYLLKKIKERKLTNVDGILDLDREMPWGFFVNRNELNRFFPELTEKEYYNGINEVWNEIEFSDEIKKVFALVEQDYKKIKNYTAIHLRIADTIYNGFRFHQDYVGKAVFIEIFLYFIIEELSKGKNFYIATDSVDHARELLMYIQQVRQISSNSSHWGEVVLIDDIIDESKLPNINEVRTLYDILMLSKSKVLIGASNSAFGLLAKMVGKSEYINLEKVYPFQKNYEIIMNYRRNMPTDLYLTAYSSTFIYYYKHLLNLSRDKIYDILLQSLRMNTIEKYDFILLLEFYIYYKEYAACEHYIQTKLINNNIDETLDNLLYCKPKALGRMYKILLKAISQIKEDISCYKNLSRLVERIKINNKF